VSDIVACVSFDGETARSPAVPGEERIFRNCTAGDPHHRRSAGWSAAHPSEAPQTPPRPRTTWPPDAAPRTSDGAFSPWAAHSRSRPSCTPSASPAPGAGVADGSGDPL